MLLRLASFALNEKKIVEIHGDEPWLLPVYEEFFARNGGQPQADNAISGLLTLIRTGESTLSLTAAIRFSPMIECSSCQGPVSWHVDETFERSFRVSKEVEAVVELTAEDLDEDVLYEDQIDLAAIVNETLVLAMPTQTSESCAACQNDVSDRNSRLVYAGQAKGEQKSQPFQVLKDLL